MSDRGWWSGRTAAPWRVGRLKDLVEVTNGFPFDASRFSDVTGTPLIRIRDLMRGYTETYFDGPVPDVAVVEDGDLLVGMDGDFNSGIWTGGRAALNQRMCRLQARPGFDQRFLRYLVDLPLRYINDLTYATTVKHLSSNDLLDERIPLPPLPAQRAIADYLDTETARIDALIAKKQRMIKLLQDRLRLAPEDSLTRLRTDSELVALKYLVRDSDHRRGDQVDRELLSVSIHLGVVPRSEASDKESRADDFTNYKTCERGDIVINRMRAFQGAVGVAGAPGIVSPDYTVLTLGARLDPHYVHFLMRSHWFVGEMASRIRGIGAVDQGQVRTPRVNFADLREIAVPVPALDIQARLVSGWRAQETSFRNVVEQLERQIDLLREHRQTLITVAVTGELEVPGVAG